MGGKRLLTILLFVAPAAMPLLSIFPEGNLRAEPSAGPSCVAWTSGVARVYGQAVSYHEIACDRNVDYLQINSWQTRNDKIQGYIDVSAEGCTDAQNAVVLNDDKAGVWHAWTTGFFLDDGMSTCGLRPGVKAKRTNVSKKRSAKCYQF